MGNPMDHLAALKKLTINRDGKIQWPSILASTNSSWLASSNKNLEINQPASTWIRTHYEKLRKDDNNKWLMESKNNDKKQTDLVTLTEWLHIPSTTSTESLPGKRPESIDDIKEDPKLAGNSNSILFGRITKMDNQQWLHSSSSEIMDESSLMKSTPSSKDHPMAGNSNSDDHESVKSANRRPACSVIFPSHPTSLDNWLINPQCAKQIEKNQNLLSQWNEQALHVNWNKSNSIKVEEWLKEAFDDEEENNFDDDFDESSIEIIDHH